jgi:hypothetical protein
MACPLAEQEAPMAIVSEPTSFTLDNMAAFFATRCRGHLDCPSKQERSILSRSVAVDLDIAAFVDYGS